VSVLAENPGRTGESPPKRDELPDIPLRPLDENEGSVTTA
jgi:hypothetical protein